MLIPAELKLTLQKHASEFPVPIVDIAQDLGLEIYETDDFTDREAGLIRREADQFVVYLNTRHPYRRKRFTIAHAIAHYILHRNALDELTELVDSTELAADPKSSETLSPAERQMEQEADQLAAEILLPDEAFKKVWQETGTIEAVAEYFAVSTSVATLRGQTLLATTRF